MGIVLMFLVMKGVKVDDVVRKMKVGNLFFIICVSDKGFERIGVYSK